MQNLPSRLEYGALLLGWLVACGSGAKESATGETGDVEDGGTQPVTAPVDDDGGSQGRSPPGSFGLGSPGGGDGGTGTTSGTASSSSSSGGSGASSSGGSSGASSSGGGATGALDASLDDATAGGTGGGSSGSLDANGLGVDSRAAYCAGSGPPVTVGDNVSGILECAGTIAELTFSHALCTCEDTSVQGVLATDSFNSNVASYQPGQYGAPVGVNRNFLTAGVPDIGGSLVVDGPDGVTLAGAADVHGDFEVQGTLTLAGISTVSRDLWVGGNLTTAGVIDVGRNLNEGAGALTLGLVDVGGTTTRAPFTLDEPCACEPNEILDVGAIVAEGRTQNDNASVGLSPDAFDVVVGVLDQDLPCGRFYLNQIAGAGALTFHVSGRTALFVGGDIAAAGILSFDVGPAGELDVFVAGNLIPTGVTSFGSIARPAAVRVYVAGSSTVALTGAGDFVGNIYAPNANVVFTGFSDVYGSVFANNFEAPGAVFIHYDSAVLQAGQECPTPPPGDDGGGTGVDDASAPPAAEDDASAPVVDASTAPPPALDAGSPPPPVVDAGTPPPPVVDAGAATPPAVDAGQSCNDKCGTCGNAQACINGHCGQCTNDGECCSPLVCQEGYCIELVAP